MQPLNAPASMVVRPSGKVTEESPLQPSNAYSRMVVRLLGKVTEVSPMQFSNAYSPMVVKLSGRSIVISFSNLKNAFLLIASTPSGMVMRVTISLYGFTMSWVMTLVSSEKVKWVLIIAFGIQCSFFHRGYCTKCIEYLKYFYPIFVVIASAVCF